MLRVPGRNLFSLVLALAQVLLVDNGVHLVTMGGKIFLNATYMLIMGKKVMAYWSYHPCTLLVLESKDPLILRVKNLCPFPITVPITIKFDKFYKVITLKKCVGRSFTTLTYPKCLIRACLNEFPVGKPVCVRRGLVTVTKVEPIKGGYLVKTKVVNACIESARRNACINWTCLKTTTVTKVESLCSYTYLRLTSSGQGLNPISVTLYVAPHSYSERVVAYHEGGFVVYAWGLPYIRG